MVDQTVGGQTAIIRVLSIRAQNRNGVIFRGQRISKQGDIIDTHSRITVRIQRRGIGVSVRTGQWWRVTGKITYSTFINDGGFEMTEEQMEVEPGHASMEKPSGFNIVSYIANNPRIEGIGPITAEKLWETFGGNLFGALEERDTAALADVIGAQRASMLVQVWHDDGLSTSIQWLHEYGIEAAIGRRILAYFGREAAAKVTENPYRLLSFAAGWKEVDKFAIRELGVQWDDERRLAAAIEEAVYRRFSLGHTYVPRSDLVSGLRTILVSEGHSRALIDQAIEQSAQTGRLLFDSQGNAYSLGACILENIVAEGIFSRIATKSLSYDVDKVIRAYEERESTKCGTFKLNKEQREAAHLIAEHDFALITGGAGCGKTTVLKCAFEVLELQGYDIKPLALAGKAAKRIFEATERPAKTIASFISEMKRSEGEEQSGPTRKAALVIDEASMVDLISFSTVLRLIDADTKIVMVGDPHQLPPVGPGLILHCLTDLSWIPHVELKVPKRFGSEIAKIANLVKDGVFPGLEQFHQTVSFQEASEDEMRELCTDLYLEHPEDSIILCATRTVAKAINSAIQSSLTICNKPLRLFNFEFNQWQHAGFFEGDLLICTRNHWDIGIQNGSLGMLVEAFDEPSNLDTDSETDLPALGWIQWDDGERRPLRENLLDNLDLGYALTIHKSQGSQWQRVVVCLPAVSGNQSRSVDRSLIYTAITRAKSQVVLCGHHESLVTAVKCEKAADRRRVGLPKRLRMFTS